MYDFRMFLKMRCLCICAFFQLKITSPIGRRFCGYFSIMTLISINNWLIYCICCGTFEKRKTMAIKTGIHYKT